MRTRTQGAAILGTLLASCLSFPADAQSGQANDNCTLKIIEKSLDAETGMLSVELWNGGEIPVEEFAISVIGKEPRDRGRSVFGEGFHPEMNLAPGASSVRRFMLDPGGGRSLDLADFEIELYMEIRSDNSTCGKGEFIERSFRHRLRKFVELDAGLACLRSREADAVQLADEVERLFQEVGACGDEAGEALEARLRAENPSMGVRIAGSRRSAASSLTDQMVEQFEGGTSAEFLLGVLEEALEREVEEARLDLRPSDLEWLDR